jgi:hypothetical protein
MKLAQTRKLVEVSHKAAQSSRLCRKEVQDLSQPRSSSNGKKANIPSISARVDVVITIIVVQECSSETERTMSPLRG